MSARRSRSAVVAAGAAALGAARPTLVATASAAARIFSPESLRKCQAASFSSFLRPGTSRVVGTRWQWLAEGGSNCGGVKPSVGAAGAFCQAGGHAFGAGAAWALCSSNEAAQAASAATSSSAGAVAKGLSFMRWSWGCRYS